jgi:hypothetical protein
MIRAYLFPAAMLLAAATSADATTLVYSIEGVGEARTQSSALDFGTGEYVDGPSSIFFGAGAFSAVFKANAATLPPNNPPAGGAFDYSSYGGAPNFLTSSTSAFIGGEEFGITSDGSIGSRIGSPYGMFGSFIMSDFSTRVESSNPIRTYYDSGAVKTETFYESYNQFYSFTGGTVVVDGVELPDFANGGSIQSFFTQNIQAFDEDGTRRVLSFSSREFIGNGTVTLSTVGAGVPEPASWALMIAGFGLVGHGLRRKRTRPALARIG